MKKQGIFQRLIPSLALIVAGALSATAQSSGAAETIRDQADAFLSQAASLFGTGASSSASRLLASAFQLAPDYSEALYLRARMELSKRESTTAAVADLRTAIQNGSWRGTDPDQAKLDLAEVLVRVGQAAEALPLARQEAALHPEAPRAALVLSRCLAAAGDVAAARATASDSLKRLPEEDELRLLTAVLQESQGQRSAARDTIATGRRIHPNSLPLLLNAARLASGAERLAAAAAYLAAKGTDPLAAVLGMEAAGADRKKYLDSFLALGGLSRQDLVDRAIAAVKSDKPLAASLQDALAHFSGWRDLDANGDGFWEDRWTFAAGALVGWIHDPAQDGVALFTASFGGGQPLRFSYRTGEGLWIEAKFSRYPFVESATAERGDTFFIVPYILRCEFLTAAASAGIGTLVPRVLAKPKPPTFDQIRVAAYRQEGYGPDGTTIAHRIDLAAGRNVYLEEDGNGDGIIDHRVWFVDGLPIRGERSLGASSAFTVKESWGAGSLTGVDLDTDGDGVPDYHESYGAGTVRTWDWNEDGKADSREYRGSSGEMIREISTALNGVFDFRIVSDGAGIRSLTRGGKAVTATIDRDRGITWIGQPAPAGTEFGTLPTEGLHAWGPRQYLVFRELGILYAEALE